MKLHIAYIFSLLLTNSLSFGQASNVALQKNDSGITLLVEGQPFMINGMNWDYYPIGTNYTYSLWNQSDDFIKAALDEEMTLLKNMGVNTIRQYTGVPSRWITYIFENYGIYTMLNHTFGRYGLTIDGSWVANTDYGDERVRSLLLSEVQSLTNQYKNTPGLLIYLLGNENNYGLVWEGAETENIPKEDKKSNIKARNLYKLFNDAAVLMKKIDGIHPIAICNGDLFHLDLIVSECKDVDILGTNTYRGASFGDAFNLVKREYGKPLMFTEFGSDAFNAQSLSEDQFSQAYYLVENWKEIYKNASGLGQAQNSIGGFTFQFSDGWWKFGQTKNLDVHDNNASWSNGGYSYDYKKGENNMNEEWFGICAKGPIDPDGHYHLIPRAAYFALKQVHSLDIYSTKMNSGSIESHFEKIDLMDAVKLAQH